MNRQNQAPKTGTKIMKGLAASSAVLALTAGAYLEGRAIQAHNDRGNAAVARIQGKQEIADQLLKHPKPLERFKWVESQTAEKVKGLKNNQLFNNAAKVQSSVLAISTELGISGQEIFERLVPEDAQEAYLGRNVRFLFVKDDPTNPDCLNPFALDRKDGQFEVGFFPLDASPDNPHPDNDPRIYNGGNEIISVSS